MKLLKKLEVKVLPVEGLASRHGLRVMGSGRQRSELSVDRGMCRPGIELRNNHREGRPCWVIGNAKSVKAPRRVFTGFPGVIASAACMDASQRNAGGPIAGQTIQTDLARRMKVFDRTIRMNGNGKSDVAIVVKKRGNKVS